MHRPRSVPLLVVLAALVVVTTALPGSAMSASSREQAGLTPPAKNGLIAFRRYFDSEHKTGAIFTIQTNGKGERQLTKPEPGIVDDDPDWASDGSLVVFTRSESPRAAYTVRPDGSGLKRVSPACSYTGPDLETQCEDGSDASLLPGGDGVAYVRATGHVRNLSGETWIEHSEVAVRDLDGGSLQVLITSPSYSGDFYEPQFAPDGQRLVYVRENSPLAKPSHGLAVFVANADGSRQHRITPWSLHAGDDPDWSPDGKLILFKSYVDGPKQSQLYVVRPDGKGLKQLTHFKPDTIVTSASFSPDGKWITFATNGAGGQADVFVMRTNGKGIRAVTHTKLWDSAPDWGPTP